MAMPRVNLNRFWNENVISLEKNCHIYNILIMLRVLGYHSFKKKLWFGKKIGTGCSLRPIWHTLLFRDIARSLLSQGLMSVYNHKEVGLSVLSKYLQTQMELTDIPLIKIRMFNNLESQHTITTH